MENLNQLEIFYKALNEALYALQKHFIEYGEWNKYYELYLIKIKLMTIIN